MARDKILLHPLERRPSHQSEGFILHDKNFTDDGYPPISSYSKTLGDSTVELYSIAEQKILHEWPLPLGDIAQRAESMTFTGGNPLDKNSFLFLHPPLLADGANTG